MPSLIAKLKATPQIKSCLIELSNTSAEAFVGLEGAHSQNGLVTFCLETSSKKKHYISWSGKFVGSAKDQYVVSFGKRFADALELLDGELVTLSLLKDASPCEVATVVPLNEESWEILDLNSKDMEQHLLDQIRVVYPGLVFPVFLRGSTVVLLRVESTVPNKSFTYLQQFTEIHVSPFTPNRRAAANILDDNNSDVSNKSLSENYAVNLTKRQTLLEWPVSLLKDMPTGNQKISNQSEPSTSSLWNYLTSWFLANNEEIRNNHNKSFKIGTDKTFDLKDKTQDTLQSVASSGECSSTGNLQNFSSVLRVHPVVHQNAPCIKFGPDKENHCCNNERGPLQTFVNNRTYSNLVWFTTNAEIGCSRKSIVVKLTKLKSPKERKLIKKKIQSKDTVDTREDNTTVVEAVMVSNEDTFPNDPFVLDDHIAVSDHLISCLKLKTGALVKLECVSQAFSEPVGILLTPLQKSGEALNNTHIISLFMEWVKNRSFEDNGMLLVNKMILKLGKDNRTHCTTLLHILSKGSHPEEKMQYFRLTLNRLNLITIEVSNPGRNENDQLESFQPFSKGIPDLRDINPAYGIHRLGGMSHLFSKGINHMQNVLQSELFFGIKDSAPSLNRGAILICGTAASNAVGSGRTSLAKALCEAIHKAPYFAHVDILDCTPLRGKKPETIQEIWKDAFTEARWHQPSVLVFDDLDLLIANPDPVQDPGATILYHSRLAEGFKDLLRQEIELGSKIVIIVICKSKNALHPVLRPPSGWHFFHCILEIDSPDAAGREEILRSLLSQNELKMMNTEDLGSKTFKVSYHERTRKSFVYPANSEKDVDLRVPVEVFLFKLNPHGRETS